MHAHPCTTCDQLLFFDNSACLRCGTSVGYDLTADRLASLDESAQGGLAPCKHRDDRGCNWLVPATATPQPCLACRLTRAHPDPAGDAEDVAAWLEVEQAKRHLVAELVLLGLPVQGRDLDPERGLAFDLLSSRAGAVTTGHQDGVVTLDLAEADDVHREQLRVQLDEPYRTVLGHLRHEVGHYYWQRLLEGDEARLAAARNVFGDDRQDYAEALAQSYEQGPPPNWQERHVSSYAAAHPWEDFAETFAHVLHVCDGLRTASAVGLAVGGRTADAYPDAVASPGPTAAFEHEVTAWLTLTLALNAMSRSIGRPDLYPFVLSDEVRGKLSWVHELATTWQVS